MPPLAAGTWNASIGVSLANIRLLIVLSPNVGAESVASSSSTNIASLVKVIPLVWAVPCTLTSNFWELLMVPVKAKLSIAVVSPDVTVEMLEIDTFGIFVTNPKLD